MKAIVIGESNGLYFNRSLNRQLDLLKEREMEIIDIKLASGEKYLCAVILYKGSEKYMDKVNKNVQNNWNNLKAWLSEQEQKAWDEVSNTFGYVLDKMQELENKDD